MLLLKLAQLKPSFSREEAGAFEENKIDWTRLQFLAVKHKMAPLVYLNARELVDEKKLQASKDVYLMALMNNSLLMKELERIRFAFEREGLFPVLLKGFTLLPGIYQKPEKRFSEDIDLLLAPQELKKAERVLEGMSYRLSVEKGVNWDLFRKDNLQKLHRTRNLKQSHFHHFQFRHQENDVMVELHWGFCPPRKGLEIDLKEFIKASRPQKIGKSKVLVFSPEHQLVFLCIHALKHFLDYTFRDFVDIHEYTKRKSINWEKVLDISKRTGAKKYVYFGLLLSESFYGPSTPKTFRGRLNLSPFKQQAYAFLAKNIFFIDRFPRPLVRFLNRFVINQLPFEFPL